VKMLRQACIAIVLSLLIHSGAAGQSLRKRSSATPQTTPRINVKARFQSLDPTKRITLTDYEGKTVVLVLLASWCGPCRMVVNALGEAHQEFIEREVQVIALSNENPQKADTNFRKFVATLPSDYQVGWIGKISANQLMVRKGVVPQTFVIRDGVILKTYVGWNPTTTMIELRKALDQAQGKKAIE
jgi:peroxiredoxin